MNYEMVNHLIRKEWYFSRIAIAFLFGLGAIMLIALWFTTMTEWFFLRLVLFILFYAVFNFMFWLPTATILSERTEQTLAFLVSLPITIKEYTAAKIIAHLGVFYITWLLLGAGIIGLYLMSESLPDTYIRPTIIMLLEVPVMYCLMMAAALVSESGIWTMLTGIVTNVVFWFSFGLIGVLPGMGVIQDPVETWNRIWWLVPAELAAVPVIIGLTIYFQSRKTDFLK